MSGRRILVVDDEVNILKSFKALLESRGHHVVVCEDPREAVNLALAEKVELVFLDIWMPQQDGYEVLERLKERIPLLPVVIMSGHASVTAGVEAAKRGADDFLEKPFQSDQIFELIRRHLGGDARSVATPVHPRLAFARLLRPSGKPQRTLAKAGLLKGKGLHTGESTGLIVAPLGPDQGIWFEDISTGHRLPASVLSIDTTSYATNLRSNGVMVACVEHLLSALHACGIDNAEVRVSKELPILDGSSQPFCTLLRDLGTVEQKAERQVIRIDRVYEVVDPQDAARRIRIEPADELSIDFELDLRGDWGLQRVAYVHHDVESYQRDIAPARTFGFLEELRQLQSNGLGQGGDLENFILLDEERSLNTAFRLSDELARHKILDVMGDLYLAGAPVLGKVTASRTGHRHTIELLRALREDRA